MGKQKNGTDVTEQERRTIEEWKKVLGTSDAVFAGVSVKQSWCKGRQVTKAEYESAVNSFLKSNIGGKK